MKRLIRFLVLSFIIFQSATAQSLVTAEIQKNSSLTINGSTNLLSFKIYQDGDKLSRNKFTVATTQNQNKIFVTQNQLSVIVKNFVSTNVLALRDFFKLLKSDISPTLQVQLSSLDLQPINQKGKVYNGQAIVNITITGKTKQYAVPISFNNNGNVYIVDGCKKMSIRDFGLTPETKMMGMIKVSEWIDVDFHIICKISTNREIAAL
ncbi:YceI-like domain-containing protein [Flavobacterium fluvii]|uniref:YceI-like domain-containing protein n=1 Tax=Flavobacterium fluvii TaxID=468056 RepID=A0A1M5L1R5_9FLAO|nr:YceI family protein [Flavobacterium fluvii]SHG58689.1 YceI-like domain-containing protein [Flavobacterium fluvii]